MTLNEPVRFLCGDCQIVSVHGSRVTSVQRLERRATVGAGTGRKNGAQAEAKGYRRGLGIPALILAPQAANIP